MLRKIGVVIVILSLIFYGFLLLLLTGVSASGGPGSGIDPLALFFELPSFIFFIIGCLFIVIARNDDDKNDS